MLNKKGEALATSFIVILTLTVGLIGTGFYKTYQNGVLKNNGKIIWCKMQNKGADYCDNKYLPFSLEGEES